MALIGKDEMETVVVNNLGQDYVLIHSNVVRDISKLERHPGVEVVRSGRHGRTRWIEARVPMGQWSPTSGIKRTRKSTMTDEQRAAAAARLANARKAKEINND